MREYKTIIAWSEADIETLRPNTTVEERLEMLSVLARSFQEASVKFSLQVLETLLELYYPEENNND